MKNCIEKPVPVHVLLRMKIYSFPYIASPNAKILILGTMPGVQSLEKQQYYGHPQNHFWKILFALFDTPFTTDYATRKNLLLDNRIALWDVLQACIRPGSLDSAIAEEIPNDFAAFLTAHPHITHIYFNGQKAAHFFKRYVTVDSRYRLTTLPSTSPAHASKAFEIKLNEWEIIKENP